MVNKMQAGQRKAPHPTCNGRRLWRQVGQLEIRQTGHEAGVQILEIRVTSEQTSNLPANSKQRERGGKGEKPADLPLNFITDVNI